MENKKLNKVSKGIIIGGSMLMLMCIILVGALILTNIYYKPMEVLTNEEIEEAINFETEQPEVTTKTEILKKGQGFTNGYFSIYLKTVNQDFKYTNKDNAIDNELLHEELGENYKVLKACFEIKNNSKDAYVIDDFTGKDNNNVVLEEYFHNYEVSQTLTEMPASSKIDVNVYFKVKKDYEKITLYYDYFFTSLQFEITSND